MDGGAVLGAVLAIGLGRASDLGAGGLVSGGLLGAIAGALGGACLALSWAVERPSPLAGPPDGPRDLWDPWLDERGRPTIKIGASEPTSGLSVAGPTGTKETYVILQAKGTASSLKLKGEDGRERLVEP